MCYGAWMHIRFVAPVLLLTLLAGSAGCGTGAAPETPGAAPDASREAPAAAKLDLSGTITFDGAFTGAAVFVFVKDPANPGPPLAAKQLPPGPFPLTFTLTQADVVQMGPSVRPIPANVALSAKFDLDGNAMSKDPSEPIATLETPSTSSNLTLTMTAPAAH